MADGDQPDTSQYSLPISKLRGVPQTVRVRLKSRRITNSGQLLSAAGRHDDRDALQRSTAIEPDVLLKLVQRADMSRVNGVGAVFGLMLEDLGINDVVDLANEDPAELHRKLRDYNQAERLARRSPTPEEVEEWVNQARALDPLVTYADPPGDSPSTSSMP